MPVTINGSAGVTTNTGAVYDGLQRATAVTASGTSVDFTSIPSWVERITIIFNGVSLSGTSAPLIQIGSGSITTTGYTSLGGGFANATGQFVLTSTNGYIIAENTASRLMSLTMTLVNISGNIWVESHSGMSTSETRMGGGTGSLSGTLDRVRITTVNGTDTFDAGSINIIYE